MNKYQFIAGLFALLALTLGGCAKQYRNQAGIYLTGPQRPEFLIVEIPVCINRSSSPLIYLEFQDDHRICRPVVRGDSLFYVGSPREIAWVKVIAFMEGYENLLGQTKHELKVYRTFLYAGEPFVIDDVWLHDGWPVHRGVVVNWGDRGTYSDQRGNVFTLEPYEHRFIKTQGPFEFSFRLLDCPYATKPFVDVACIDRKTKQYTYKGEQVDFRIFITHTCGR